MPAPKPLPAIAPLPKFAATEPYPSPTSPRSQSVPELLNLDTLPSINPWIRWGGLAISTSVGVVIALAAVTPYAVTVQAEATVRPTGELKRVESLMAGSIVRILAQENQRVQAGQAIAQLDDSTIRTRKQQLETKIEQAQLQIQQINAQIQNLEARLQAERDRNLQALRSGRVQLQQARRIHQDQKIVASSNVDEALAQLRSEQFHLNAAHLTVQRYQSLVNEGAVARATLEAAQLQVQQHQGEIAAMQAKLQRLQALLNPNDAGVAIAQETMAQETSHHRAAIAHLNQEKEELIQQRIDIQQQQRQDQQELQQTLHDLRKTVILAPISGTLFQSQLRNPGQTVMPGSAIAQIVPPNSAPTLKAIVQPTEISHIVVGQQAQLRITACPYTDFGTVKAFVQAISPDVISPVASASKTQALAKGYEITLKPAHLEVSNGNQTCRLQPGMSGRADITTHKAKALQLLLEKLHFFGS